MDRCLPKNFTEPLHDWLLKCRVCVRDNFADQSDVKFNANKLIAMRIGNRYNKMCEPCMLSGSNLQFVFSLKYLSIVLLSDKRIKLCVKHVNVKFFGLLIV